MSHTFIHRNSSVNLEYVKLEVYFFVMSVTEFFKTKILTAFVNEIKVSFLLIANYHVSNI